jgi:hypothetical protein
MNKKLFAFLFFLVCNYEYAFTEQPYNLEKSAIEYEEYESVWQEYTEKTIVDIKQYNLSFDDGSEWAIGYWWLKKLETWQIGDKIHISTPIDLAYYFFRIDNLTKQETVWSTGTEKQPDPYFSKCLWIQEINKIKTGYSIKTDNGLIIEITKYCEKWFPGDVLTILKSSWPDGKPALFHHDSGIIIGTSCVKTKFE